MAADRPTVEQMLAGLAGEGLFDLEGQPAVEAALAAAPRKERPWYIRGCMAVSAWIAAILIVAALTLLMPHPEDRLLVVGAVLLIVAIVVHNALAASDFASQLALAVSIAGQLSLVAGLLLTLHLGVEPILLITILLQVALVLVYRDWLHRFLSTLVIIGCLAGYLFLIEPRLQLGLGVLLGLLTALIWEKELDWAGSRHLLDILPPAAMGITLGGLGLVAPLVGRTLEALGGDFWWLLSVGLCAVLLYQEHRIIVRHGSAVSTTGARFAAGVTVTVAALTVSTPGLLLAVLVLVVGFQHGNRAVFWAAAAFLGWFLVFYYYNLALTLLVKSIVLFGSGLMLLAVRWLVQRQPGAERRVGSR